jgi:ribosome-associated translation inhibitor RaiA
MQVLFETRHPEARSLRELSEQRVRFAMRRLNGLLPRVKVRLSDVNGPRGGVDKRCQIELDTENAGKLVIAAVARDWRCALDQALARAARKLVRVWRRGQRPARTPVGANSADVQPPLLPG